MRRIWLALLLTATLCLGLWGGWQAREFIAIDRCLDAGGAWDYDAFHCTTR